MGLFSKTDIYVSSVAYNIAGEASGRANFLKHSLIFLNAAEQSVGEKLPRMYLQSLGIKLKRAFRHAAALPQGLPTSSMQLWEYTDFEEAVQALLDAEHGSGKFFVEDVYFTESNTAPVIETYLHRVYGWDAITGLMTNPPQGFASSAVVEWSAEPPQSRLGDRSPRLTRGYRVEFRHSSANVTPDLVVNVSLEAALHFAQSTLVALVAEGTSSVRSDTTTTRAFQPGDVNDTSETSTEGSIGAKKTTTTTTVTVTTDGTTTTIRTRVVDYTHSERVPHQYALGTGEWPTLDALWNSKANEEQAFFPSIPFRLDNKDVLDDKLSETDNYKQVHKICTLMGISASGLRDQINTNESIKDIDYAFLVAGVNMNTQSQAEMDYLYRFWDMCRERQTVGEVDHNAWVAAAYFGRTKPKVNELIIQDPESKNGAYMVKISWDYINKVVVDGLIDPTAKVGKYAMVVGQAVTHDISDKDSIWQLDSSTVSIRKQISPTQYEELRIVGAVHRNEVYKGKGVQTLARKARETPDDETGFVIPLHMGIFNSMSLVKRTQLAQECMYLVFNCYKKVKRKWYQTGAFKFLLAIILIVITVLTWGIAAPATSGAWAAYCASVAAAVGVSAALVSMVLSFVIGYIVSYLMGKWSAGFESIFGKKWAAVVQAVVAIVVSYYTGGLQTNQGWLKTAVQIIDIATQLFTAYAKGVALVRQDEFNAFMDKAEEDQKKLEQLSTSFFGENDLVSVDYLLQLQKTLREDSPSVFLARTLMVGSDVVDMTLGMVSEMVSLETTPRLQGVNV